MSNSATSCTSTSFTRTLSTSGGSLSRTPSRSLSCSFKTPSTSTCSLSRTLSSTSASGSSKTPSTSTVSLSRTPCASLTSLSKSPVRKDSPVMPMSSNSKARKFPGPAGMLPKLTPGQHLDNVASPKPGKRKTPSPTQKTRSLASIGQEDDFKSDAWLAMMKEMQTAGIPLMMQFTVTELLRKAALQQLNHGKVPYMCTLIKSFSVMGNDASVILKDPTGEIHGTVHRKVLECHLGDLGPGAGVLLKQVSVFSPSPRRHYINITPGNILKIYPPDPEQLASSQPLNTQCPQQVYDSSESDYVDLMDDDEDAILEEMKDEGMTTQSDDTPNQQFEDLLGVLDDDDDIFNDEALLL